MASLMATNDLNECHECLPDGHGLRPSTGTLAHEMCHAAQWLLEGEKQPPHGAAFQLWARAFERAVPGMSIKTCHTYDVFGGKFRYTCTGCGHEFARHSKSVDVERKCCGSCGGRLTFVGTFERDGTPSKPRTANVYAQFVKLHYAALKQAMPGASQADVMAALGQRWRDGKRIGATGNPSEEHGAKGAGIGAGIFGQCEEAVLDDDGDDVLGGHALAALRLSE